MAASSCGNNMSNCSIDVSNPADPERKQPFLVQAVYSFKGKNNDELCFKKGEIITVTQVEEGGWWEGTLGEKTGWFPSNYVNQYKLTNNLIGNIADNDPKNNNPVAELNAQQKLYRGVVLKDLIDSERAHLTELQGLMNNFLIPLEKADIMKISEYNQLINNLHEVVSIHDALLNSLVEVSGFPGSEQRVGKVFLNIAPQLKQVLTKYCSNHPRSVCILDRYKQELSAFMESNGAASPGLLVLTAGLSKPFRRLEKYAGMLQELERHVEENHVDRGDTQRSVSVFKDIASLCSVIRRQKEMELEVISGRVRGWEGEDLSCLGDIIHMGSVAVGPEHHDRYLVLFPSTLLMLSVSHRMSAFIYEGKLPLAGICVNKLDDANSDSFKNAFEIVGPMIERIVAVCQTKEDQQSWVDLIRQQIRSIRVSSPLPSSTPAPPPHSPIANNSTAITNMISSSSSGILQQLPHNSIYHQQQPQQDIDDASHSSPSRPWSVSCLRPSPPLRTIFTKDDNKTVASQQQSGLPGHGLQNSSRKASDKSFEEDAQILRVIEGYCASVKSRYTISSALIFDAHRDFHLKGNDCGATKSVTMPQLLMANEEEKFVMCKSKADDSNDNNNNDNCNISSNATFVSANPAERNLSSSISTNRSGSTVSYLNSCNKIPVIEEKNLADTVYILKEEITALHCKLATLSDRLQEERLARNQLQTVVNNCLLSFKQNSHIHSPSTLRTQHQHSSSKTSTAAAAN